MTSMGHSVSGRGIVSAILSPWPMTGTMYWIDHYTVPTNDLGRAIAFHERVLGVATMPDSGLPRERGVFQAFAHPELLLHGGHCHQGLFLMREPLPPAQELGSGYP